MQKGVYQRARVVSRPGMDNHSGGFVYDNDIRILIKNLDRQFFGFCFERSQVSGFNGNAFAAVQNLGCFRSNAVDQNATVFDPGLQPGTAEFRQLVVQQRIEALASIRRLCRKDHNFMLDGIEVFAVVPLSCYASVPGTNL